MASTPMPSRTGDASEDSTQNALESGGESAAGKFKVTLADPVHFSLGRIGKIQHNFHLHPLMQMDRLAQLAKSLNETQQCRFIMPGTADDSVFDHNSSSPDGRDIDEVFRRIEEPKSWIALYNIQTDPTYGKFLWEVMESLGNEVKQREKIYDVRGFMFISAPPSVTPFHIDRENNFWLQIHGRKTLQVWDRMDRDVVAARDVEKFMMFGSLENVRLREEMRSRSNAFECGPGDGVYFPSTSPHMTQTESSWVKPGNGTSVSIGIVFYTDVTRRQAYVHGCNGVLRRLGLNPAVAGTSAWQDRIKYPAGRAFVEMKRRLQGYVSPPGF